MTRGAMWKTLALAITTTAGVRYLKIGFNLTNYRNPSDHDNPWCYKHPGGAWEDCEVPLCSSITTTTTPSSISSSSSSASTSSSTVASTLSGASSSASTSLSTTASTTKPEGTECLEDAKGRTYRGSVSETVSGLSAQIILGSLTKFINLKLSSSSHVNQNCRVET